MLKIHANGLDAAPPRVSWVQGTKFSDAMGNNPIENLIKPYPAIFNKIAARRTEPAVGASTCASGNQV